MKKAFKTPDDRERHLYYSRALATHFTPDGLPCRYVIYGEVWHVPRNAPLLLTRVG